MNPETEAADWLLKHGEESLSSLRGRISPHYQLLPDFAYEIFLDSYESEVLKILKNDVMMALNLNPEQIALFFSKQFVIMLLGKEIFVPPKLEMKECLPKN